MALIKKLISFLLSITMLISIATLGVLADDTKNNVCLTIATDKIEYSATDTVKVLITVKGVQSLRDVVICANSDNWLLAKGSNSNILEIGTLTYGESKELSFDAVLNRSAKGVSFLNRFLLFVIQLFNKPTAFKKVAYPNRNSEELSVNINQGGAKIKLTAICYYVIDTTYEYIEFGSYPQSQVKDKSLISNLNSLDGMWHSYNYYIGTDTYFDGKMISSDYMRYKDVTYKNNKYRAVTFEKYRPYRTDFTSSEKHTHQDDNGFTTKTVYWFKYEPLRWRVLDKENGLVLCETIIDSQPFSNFVIKDLDAPDKRYHCFGDQAQTYLASDYANSSIRAWLNNDFYNLAFNETQKADIVVTTLNNSGYYTLNGTSGYERLDSTTTNDKVFFLSYMDLLNNNYGFDPDLGTFDSARMAIGSDYAKCQGLHCAVSTEKFDGKSWWWLRSPGTYSDGACHIAFSGVVCVGDGLITSASRGVRPALYIQNLTAFIVK